MLTQTLLLSGGKSLNMLQPYFQGTWQLFSGLITHYLTAGNYILFASETIAKRLAVV